MNRFSIESLEPRRLFAGLTILATGRQGASNDWILTMANDISAQEGGPSQVPQYVLKVDTAPNSGNLVATITHVAGTATPQTSSSGEIILTIDYFNISANASYGSTNIGSTIANFLMNTPVDGITLASLPIHEIGVSRGSAICDGVALALGKSGVWVDQETYLDPDPLAAQQDPPTTIYDNVAFVDDYWRNDGSVSQANDGEPANGAYNLNVYWLDSEDTGWYLAHLAPAGYYIGTVSQTETNGGDGPIYSQWYGNTPTMPARNATGWIYSQEVGSPRPLSGVWTASGGTGARTAAGQVGSQWGDATDVTITSGTTVATGNAINVSYLHEDRDSADTITFYLDSDRNPYNNTFADTLGSVNLGQTNTPTQSTATLSTAGVTPGTYWLCAKITDAAGHTRYTYEAVTAPLTVTTNSNPITASLTGSQATAASSYNLTTLGTSDWAHWGRGASAANFDHKATGGSQISNVTKLGSGANYGGYSDGSRNATWTDGTPAASDTNEHGYIWANTTIGAGYSFTVPADTTTRTLYVYAGGYSSGATLTAHLSDASAADYVATASGSGIYSNLYTITYKAASAGQTLKISYVKSTAINGTGGSVDLIAAALAGATASPVSTDTAPPAAALITAANLTAASSASDIFTVRYTDNVAINAATLGGNNILITSPSFPSQLATLVSTNLSNGPTITATYSVPAPSGGWTSTSDGIYTINLLPNQVTDTSGNFAPAPNALGTFSVNIPIPVTPAGPLGDADIGSPGLAGSGAFNSGTGVWTLAGSGADIWNSADQFNFASTTVTGDSTLIAEVTSITNTDPWAKAGLMYRDGFSASAANVALVATPGNGVSFQWRTTAAGSSSYTNISSVPIPTASAPVWLKLTRAGNVFTASYSTNGTTYTVVGTQTIAMSTALLGGLIVASHNNGLLATATFTNVAVPVVAAPVTIPSAPTLAAAAATGAVSLSWSPVAGATTYNLYRSTTPGGEGSTPYLTALTGSSYSDTAVTAGTAYYYKLTAVNSAGESGPSGEKSATPAAAIPPGPLSDADIGSPGLAGSGAFNSGTGVWTLTGSGGDIWNSFDQFNFASTSVSGDSTVIAEVTSLSNTDPWAKAGLMFRDGTDPGAGNVALVATPGNGVSFQWRATAGGSSNYTNISSVPIPTASAPVWLKLVRAGNVFTASYSTNGTTYTVVGTQTIALSTSLLGGLVVASHNNGLLATATFANVAVPVVAGPVLIPAAPTLAATAATGAVSLSWSPVAGATTYNLYRSTIPGGEGSTPYLTGLTGIAYSDTAVTASIAYYYKLTAVNSAGESAPSAEVSATPTASSSIASLSDADIGSPNLAGSGAFNSGTGVWTITGSGNDIWNGFDQFNFASTSVSGDTTLIAEVTSLSNTDPWAKAGVMLRDGTDPGAANVALVATPGNGVSFQWRSTAGGSSSFTNISGVPIPTVTAPIWLKLVRAGNVFTASYSTNGSTYTVVGTQTITLSTSLLAGLAVTSHNNGLLATATLANVSV
jgi:regulation of enolase protein 1 (concanavalin A-like superfamily)